MIISKRGTALSYELEEHECALNVLAELGERTKKSWIFIHESIIKTWKDNEIKGKDNMKIFYWAATKEYPEATVLVRGFSVTGWYIINEIDAVDIAFKLIYDIKKPKNIICLEKAG